MKLNSEQKGVARGAGFAAVFSAVFLVVGYLWFPFELGSFEEPAARLVFALKADLFVFLWLVAAVGRVANIRFFSPEDIQGGGLSKPSKDIKIPLSACSSPLGHAPQRSWTNQGEDDWRSKSDAPLRYQSPS